MFGLGNGAAIGTLFGDGLEVVVAVAGVLGLIFDAGPGVASGAVAVEVCVALGFGRTSYGPAVAGLGGAFGRLAGRIGATDRPPWATEEVPSGRDLEVALDEMDVLLLLDFIGDWNDDIAEPGRTGRVAV